MANALLALSSLAYPLVDKTALSLGKVQPLYNSSLLTSSGTAYCANGILSGTKCCAESCGTCGGSGCGSRPGGSSKCCTSGFTLCTSPTDTACEVPEHNFCLNGVLDTGGSKCCAASCGTCGGSGCGGRPGGSSKCCTGSFTDCASPTDTACSVPKPVVMPVDAPLSVDYTTDEGLKYNANSRGDAVPDFTGVGYMSDLVALPTPGFCSAGYSSGTSCCPASCGRCGGPGCSGLPGGTMCCSGSVKRSGNTCSTPWETGCVMPSPPAGASSVATAMIVLADGDGADDTARIQAAIDAVSALPIGSDGFRGAVQLGPGEFLVGATGLTIGASGVVLRGVGDGADTASNTIVRATGASQYTVVSVAGSASISKSSSTTVPITDSYVPVGATSVGVSSASGFEVGDLVVVTRPPTLAWVESIGMDSIVGCAEKADCKMWTEQMNNYYLYAERTVTAVTSTGLELDAAIMQSIDTNFGGGSVTKATDLRITKVAVEYLRVDSSTNGQPDDEEHAWTAIKFDKAAHGWATHVTCRHLGWGCVNVGRYAKHVTVSHATSIDPVSIITGGRRYPFNVDGQRSLFQQCYSEYGRHTFVSGRMANGPNVFRDSVGMYDQNDIGPHHRWSTGQLYDNIRGGMFRVWDRGNSGSGHGWTGNTIVFFNCEAQASLGGSVDPVFTVQSPTNGVNYCIGCVSDQSLYTVDGPVDGTGVNGRYESTGAKHPTIDSLYEKQLAARKARAAKK